MGCGKKAWAEEIEDAAYAEKVVKYSTKNVVEVMFKVEKLQEEMEGFFRNEPTLTKLGWRYIDNIKKLIDELLQ